MTPLAALPAIAGRHSAQYIFVDLRNVFNTPPFVVQWDLKLEKSLASLTVIVLLVSLTIYIC